MHILTKKRFKMKKQILFWVAWVAIILSLPVGCLKNPKMRLNNIIAEANKQCPIHTGIGTFDRIDYDDDVVTFEYTIDNPMMSVDKFILKKAEARKIFANNITKGSTKQVLQEIVNGGASLRIQIRDVLSTKTASFDFTVEQLQDVLNTPPGNDDETALRGEEMMLNLIAPVDVDEYAKIIGGQLTPTSFTYLYSYDDERISPANFSASAIAAIKDTQGKQLISQLRADGGNVLKKFFQACINTKRSMTHLYRGEKTGHVFEYSFSPSEIESIIRKSKARIDADEL